MTIMDGLYKYDDLLWSNDGYTNPFSTQLNNTQYLGVTYEKQNKIQSLM